MYLKHAMKREGIMSNKTIRRQNSNYLKGKQLKIMFYNFQGLHQATIANYSLCMRVFYAFWYRMNFAAESALLCIFSIGHKINLVYWLKCNIMSLESYVVEVFQKPKAPVWIFTEAPPPPQYIHLNIIEVFYSRTDAKVNCLQSNFKIYIKIEIKTAPKCFGAVTPSSGSALLVLAKVTVVKIAN